MKHKYGVENNIVDALGRQIMFLFVMSVQVTRFDRIKKEYELCLEFKETYIALRDGHLRIINDHYLQKKVFVLGVLYFANISAQFLD
jgi:hypothetical protein